MCYSNHVYQERRIIFMIDEEKLAFGFSIAFGLIFVLTPAIIVPTITSGIDNGIKTSDLNNYVTHVQEKNKELGEKISEQTGLYHYEPLSVRFEKNDNDTYDLRFFGDAQDIMYGTRYSVMKNVVYTNILPERVEKYSQALKNMVEHEFNNSENISGEILTAASKPWSENLYGGMFNLHKLENYVRLVDEVYGALNDAITEYYTLDSIGPVTPYTDILGEEYKYDPTKPTIIQVIEGEWGGMAHGYLTTKYINTNFILTDISPVNKEGDKNYVYVNTLQTDDAKSFYNIQGCFVVEGENLTSEEVYQKIENHEYNEFYKGDKQHDRNTNTAENDFSL